MDYMESHSPDIPDHDDECFETKLRGMMDGCDAASPHGPNGFASDPVALPQKKAASSCFTFE